MTAEMPFDEDIMTLIMGVGEPDKPGQHGRVSAPAPDEGFIKLITDIRDMCDDYLDKCGKGDGSEKKGEPDKPEKPKKEDEEEPEI